MTVVRLLSVWTAASGRGTEFGVIAPDGSWQSLGEIAVSMETGGALAEFGRKLFLAYQGDDGSLRVISYSQEAWSEPVIVGERMMSASPSLVVHEDKLWAFYQGPDFDGTIWYANTTDGEHWTTSPEEIPGVKTSTSPGAVQFQGRLHVIHQSSKNSGYMYFTVRNPDGTWTTDTEIDGVRMTDSPAPAVFGNRLYVFHQGVSGNEELWYTSTADGRSWRDDAEIASMSVTYFPSVTVAGATMYVAANNSRRILTLGHSTDGMSWTAKDVKGTSLSGAPALIAYPKLTVDR